MALVRRLLFSAGMEPGTVLADRYVIESTLGAGGLGVVYGARHLRLARRFAIKVPRGAFDRERLLREAEAACRLQHPNVVAVLDLGELADGTPYLVMDLAEGQALRELRIPPDRAVGIVAQLAAGLAHAHDRGLVHRDLKPENVIVGPDDHARIVDFGIALARNESRRLTEIGTVIGTPGYMSPEQVCGEPVDARSDLYALGVIAYELFTGRAPFEGDAIAVMGQTLGARPARFVSPHAALVLALLEKDPAARPASAREVLERLGYGTRTPRRRERLRALV